MGVNAQTTVPSFVASQVLTAQQLNDSARTGVPVFSTTTTRDAAFGGTGEKVLAEGQMCYIEAAPQRLQVYNGTSWLDYDAEFTAFTPTWTSYTRGNGTTDSRYVRLGRFVYCYVYETLGSTSSVTGSLSFTLPVTARTAATVNGSAGLVGTGVSYPAAIYVAGTSCNIYTIVTNATYASNAGMSATIPFTWTTGHVINAGIVYEAA